MLSCIIYSAELSIEIFRLKIEKKTYFLNKIPQVNALEFLFCAFLFFFCKFYYTETITLFKWITLVIFGIVLEFSEQANYEANLSGLYIKYSFLGCLYIYQKELLLKSCLRKINRTKQICYK